MRSISDNNSQRLSKLLRYGAGLKITPDDLNIAIISAIKQSRPECVVSILKAGGDANASDDEGRPALYVLMEQGRGNPEILKALLHSGANPNKVTWTTQQTGLHAAARKGYQVCIKHFLLAGAQLDRQDSSGYTALMYAAREGHITILRSLLAERANPNAKNNNQETALHLAVKGHHLPCVDELLCQQADPSLMDIKGQNVLLLAVRDGHEELIDLLMQHKASSNAQDKSSGKTILHLAIEMCNLPLIVKLLNMGADPNVRDKEWQTPFLTALNMGRRDIMEQLLRAGCKITTTDRSFNTPLHIASINGQADMIHLFIERGLDVNLKGSGGMTPIMLASVGAHTKTVQILLQYGANCCLTDRNHASALVYAIVSKAQTRHIYDLVKVLIKANCDVDQAANLHKIVQSFPVELDENIQVNQRLYSPLELAFMRGDAALFMMLLRSGCDVSSFQCDKDTTLQNFKSVHSDLKSRYLLLRSLKKDKKRIKPLKELCRRPLLKSFGKNVGMTINSLPISEQLKGFLKFSDVDEICERYTNDDDIISPLSPKVPQSPISMSSPFVRNHRTRSTVHAPGHPRRASLQYEPSTPSLPKATWDSDKKNTVKPKISKGRSNSITSLNYTSTERRRIVSASTGYNEESPISSPIDEEPVDRPKVGFFKFMKQKPRSSKDKQSKARSHRTRDPRETITMLLHGSSEEYTSSGEITPRPLNMASIEALNEIDKSPQDDYASVNQMLYGKSLKSPDSSKPDITERLKNIRKDKRLQIESEGVENYINNGTKTTEKDILDDVFDFNSKMEALTNGYGGNDIKRQLSFENSNKKPVNNNNNTRRYPNGEPMTPESSPTLTRKQFHYLDNMKSPQQSLDKNTYSSSISNSNVSKKGQNTIERGKYPHLGSSSHGTGPRNGLLSPATKTAHLRPPSLDMSQTNSCNSPCPLSPPTSNTDSYDSSGSGAQVKFPMGDAQLMQKYLTSQDSDVSGIQVTSSQKQNTINLRDLNGNGQLDNHALNSDSIEMENSLNRNSTGRPRATSVSSATSSGSRSHGTTGSKSRIPVLQGPWSPPPVSKSKLPVPVSPYSPTTKGYGNFQRSHSVRKW